MEQDRGGRPPFLRDRCTTVKPLSRETEISEGLLELILHGHLNIFAPKSYQIARPGHLLVLFARIHSLLKAAEEDPQINMESIELTGFQYCKTHRRDTAQLSWLVTCSQCRTSKKIFYLLYYKTHRRDTA